MWGGDGGQLSGQVLGAIQNPNNGIAAALDYRQKRLDDIEEKRKEQLMNNAVADAIPNLVPGSSLDKLARTDAKKFAFTAQALGIPVNDGQAISQLAGDVSYISKMGHVDPEGAIIYAQDLVESRKKSGISSPLLERALASHDQDPNQFWKGLGILNATLNATTTDPYKTAQIEKMKADTQNDINKTDIERQRLELDRQKLAKGESPKPLDAKDVQGIQKDTTGLLNETNGVYRAAQSLDALKQRGSPLARTAAVFQFMKSLDPTSAVRESEQGQVYEAQGAAAGMAQTLNKLLGEGGLSDKNFADVVDTSKALANSAIDSSDRQVKDYLDSYGDTIPSDFKEKLQNRVPKKFEISSQPADQPKKPGGVLHVDANGNKAYVYPDGSYEEVR